MAPQAGIPGDVHQILTFGKEGFFIRKLPWAIGLALMGGFMLNTGAAGDAYLAAWVLVAAGTGYAAFVVWRWLVPAEPMLTLAPQGIRYRLTRKQDFLIPWSEVQGVEAADIRVQFRARSSLERGVPVVLIPRDYYRQHIHVDSLWQRGPSWDYYFTPRGDLVQVAFFNSILSQSAAGLRAAIEERWRAFGTYPDA